ncbi:MAG: hypothetical protein ACXVI9_10620 [Mucilaginibacter sp.]
MKKTLLLSAVAVMLLFSCRKEHSASPPPQGKKYKVTFNVTNFKSKQSAFAVRHSQRNLASPDTLTALSTYFDVFHYVVYDAQRNTVRHIVQDSTMADMGTIVDSLPPGTYRISMVAGKRCLTVRDTFSTHNDYGYGGYSWEDTFFDSFMITIGTGSVTQDVTLNRVVGKLELQILDTMPANADSLVMTVSQDAYSQDLFSGTFMLGGFITDRFAVQVPASAKGKPNFTMDRLIGNCSFQFPVTITCKAADNSVIASVTVPSVNTPPNVKTILSGDLFAGLAGHNSSQTFTTKIDTAWSNTTHQAGFSLRKQKFGH